MSNLSLIIASSVMAFIASFVLFNLARQNAQEQENDDIDGIKVGFNNALQILMFFLLIASLLMLGKSAFAEKDYCDIVVSNQTIVGNVTSFEYEHFCVANNTNSGVWVYLLPLWVIRISAIALLIYMFALIGREYKKRFGKGGIYGD